MWKWRWIIYDVDCVKRDRKVRYRKKIVFGDSNERFVLHSKDILLVYENHLVKWDQIVSEHQN